MSQSVLIGYDNEINRAVATSSHNTLVTDDNKKELHEELVDITSKRKPSLNMAAMLAAVNAFNAMSVAGIPTHYRKEKRQKIKSTSQNRKPANACKKAKRKNTEKSRKNNRG